MKNNKTLKLIAAIVAVVLIIGVLFVTNAFVGNPISSAITKNAAKKHIEENYSHLDLEIGKPTYNFKDGNYTSKAYSRTSIDTKFNIYGRGKELRDDYEFRVVDRSNTIDRLSKEYSQFIKRIVAEEFGYEDNHSWVIYGKDIYENPDDSIKLDMGFDKSLPLDPEVTLDIKLEDVSLEKIAKLLEDAHDIFTRNGCKFNQYGLIGESGSTMINVGNVKPSQMERGELLNLLEKAIENGDGVYEGISIFIKEDK